MPAHRKNSKVSCKEKDSSKSAKSTRSKRQRNDSSDEENQPQKTKRLRRDANIKVQDVELEDEEPALCFIMYCVFCSILSTLQDNHHRFPTLGRIALDILPCQALTVPCEWLFSASKQTATDLRSKLGAQRFEELQLMKYAWKHNIVDFAACNTAPVDINLKEYEDLAIADKELEEFYD